MTSPFDQNRRKFILDAASTVAAIAVGGSLSACSSGSDSAGPAPQFPSGIASGDPLNDRAILWTYAKVVNSTESVPLTWQLASDAAFANNVASGKVDATEATGFTAKIDAAQPGK